MAQSVEHVLGKDEVGGSSPLVTSIANSGYFRSFYLSNYNRLTNCLCCVILTVKEESHLDPELGTYRVVRCVPSTEPVCDPTLKKPACFLKPFCTSSDGSALDLICYTLWVTVALVLCR